MQDSLAFQVTMLRKNFTDFCNAELRERGLSQGQLFFVLYIGRHPACSPKEIGADLHMDSGHVTRSLAKLEQAGFIEQHTNPEDRRARTLSLTQTGEEAFRVSHELFGRWDDEVMANMDPEQRSQLMSLLSELTHGRSILGGETCVRRNSQSR